MRPSYEVAKLVLAPDADVGVGMGGIQRRAAPWAPHATARSGRSAREDT